MSKKALTTISAILFAISIALMAKYEVAHFNQNWWSSIHEDPITFCAIVLTALVAGSCYLKTITIERKEDRNAIRKERNKWWER